MYYIPSLYFSVFYVSVLILLGIPLWIFEAKDILNKSLCMYVLLNKTC